MLSAIDFSVRSKGMEAKGEEILIGEQEKEHKQRRRRPTASGVEQEGRSFFWIFFYKKGKRFLTRCPVVCWQHTGFLPSVHCLFPDHWKATVFAKDLWS